MLALQTPQPSAGGKGGKGKAPLAHALVRYWVPPSAADAFMDAWAQAEKVGAHVLDARVFDAATVAATYDLLCLLLRPWVPLPHCPPHVGHRGREGRALIHVRGLPLRARGGCMQLQHACMHALAPRQLEMQASSACAAPHPFPLLACSLRRLALDNHHFYSYGSWDKMQVRATHTEAQHHRQPRLQRSSTRMCMGIAACMRAIMLRALGSCLLRWLLAPPPARVALPGLPRALRERPRQAADGRP